MALPHTLVANNPLAIPWTRRIPWSKREAESVLPMLVLGLGLGLELVHGLVLMLVLGLGLVQVLGLVLVMVLSPLNCCCFF